jgi:microcystin-dependent protein
MSFWKWSRTASSNATADGSINWAEGQAPSTVNDSARAMMSAAAKYRDDIAGAIATGGTSTAYTVTSFQTYDSLVNMNGAMIAFTPHTTSGATVTLNVDGLGARPLRFAPGAANDLPAGALVQGTPYVATYYNASSEWILQGLAGNPYNIPIGGLLCYVGAAAPNASFVLPFGQAISRTTYATLFALVSTTFGVGDGSTTFNVPDLRGRVPAGKDDMGGSAASRIGSVATDSGTITGATLGSTGGSSTHGLTQAEMPSHTHTINITDPGHSHTFATGGNTGNTMPSGAGPQTNTLSTASATTGISATATSTGSGSALALLQPTIIVNYILRVL